jgi:hypothetical protein
MADEQWAEIVRLCIQRLRRGSWYRVLDATADDTVTLDVGGTPFVVDRGCVALAASRPTRWSVVRDDPPNEVLGPVYGVCPSCFERAPFTGAESEKECPACRGTFGVNWAGAV